MKKLAQFLVVGVLLFAPQSTGAQSFKNAQSLVLAHTWGSQRLPGAIWGVAIGDVDGDGAKETVLLKRNALAVGYINGNGFNLKSTHEWDGLLQGVRLYTMNLDDDPAEEIIISAVENAHPASFAIKWDGSSWKTIFSEAPWHLRVLNVGGVQKLIGQQWNTTTFFAGHVYEISFEDGKLKRKNRLDLPKGTAIYDFALLPASLPLCKGEAEGVEKADCSRSTLPCPPLQREGDRIARLNGNSPIEMYERHGKRFKKTWSSGGRFGGGLNVVEALQREPLGEADQEGAVVNREPLITTSSNAPIILAVEHDVPLRGIIGRRAWIPRGKIVAFGEDPSLGFQNKFETEEIQGYIADYAVFRVEPQKEISAKKVRVSKKTAVAAPRATTKLIVPVQIQSSMWRENQESTLLMFDLPDAN